MALNDITFVKNGNGLGRRLQSADGVAGIVFYSAALPTGFSTTERIKIVYSVAEAEALGITSALFGSIHYQVKEFFRGNTSGKLYISINAVPASTYNFVEVTSLVNYSNGEIKLVGVVADASVFAAAQITTLNTIAEGLYASFKPVSILYGAKFSTLTTATLPSAIATAPYVTTVLASDGKSASVANVGLALGTVSKAKVSESIGWIRKFNLSDGIEMEEPAIATGDKVNALTDAALSDLKDKGYLVARKYTGIAGTYFADSLTSDAATSDYSTIENVRTINKAIMGVRTMLLPELMSPLTLSAGKLSEDTIAKFELLATQALESLQFAGELSSFTVLINPDQNVLASSKLEISLSLVPLGVARKIVVNIGYALK
ncbi:hypothetical protein ABID22_000134 [Pontibacter aydingkolensis]|uniref:DUF2586 domain-containing protein n=1 Tax=Pontibacter aydingkolensis TaxID=1911536 RepID=A0ABS7CQY2_9BACT|nr:DUF2586 family protein [Pontibacter aydingkolensis]MBW7466198.1 DUF2586 domain-containing protein [Pontibacter aydingkolensis]